MKKKGLIIATIVMVLVLAVSLTTATYAWFTVSDTTTISGFDVTVTSDRKVAIGVKTDCTYDPNDKNDAGAFMYGNVTYTAPTTEGAVGGKWTNGTPGLGDAITHNIQWGAQNKAVGMTSGTLEADAVTGFLTGATYGNTGLLTATNSADLAGGKVIAANGQEYKGEDSLKEVALQEARYAIANGAPADGSTSAVMGDYAYLFLGVQAITTLEANELIITLTPTEDHATPNIGILAAIHVAVKVDGGNWQDKQFYNNAWNTPIANAGTSLSEEQENAYANATGDDYGSNVGAVVIDLKSATANAGVDIAQVQIIIYIAGYDSDCNNAASVNAAGAIDIFFHTEVAEG